MTTLSVKQYRVEPSTRAEIKTFIETYHYSHSIAGCTVDYAFKLLDGGRMIGAAFFGRMAMAGQEKPFGRKSDVIELRRLCCIDDTPKNTESFFISKMLRWLKVNTALKIVVSYADAEYGHEGTIYKASNFQYVGFSKGHPVIDYKGKVYHECVLRRKNPDGTLRVSALKWRELVASGHATVRKTAGKHCFKYVLRG